MVHQKYRFKLVRLENLELRFSTIFLNLFQNFIDKYFYDSKSHGFGLGFKKLFYHTSDAVYGFGSTDCHPKKHFWYSPKLSCPVLLLLYFLKIKQNYPMRFIILNHVFLQYLLCYMNTQPYTNLNVYPYVNVIIFIIFFRGTNPIKG